MQKVCLKCGYEGEADDTPIAACPKCGAIYAKVEEAKRKAAEAVEASHAEAARQIAVAAKAQEATAALEAKKRVQTALAAQRQREEAERLSRIEDSARAARANTTKRWHTPGFAKVLFVVYALVTGVPAMVLALGVPGYGWVIGGAVLLSVFFTAVLLEVVLAVFHMATTLEDCRAELRRISGRTD